MYQPAWECRDASADQPVGAVVLAGAVVGAVVVAGAGGGADERAAPAQRVEWPHSKCLVVGYLFLTYSHMPAMPTAHTSRLFFAFRWAAGGERLSRGTLSTIAPV